jgi:hypothetical protein
VSGKVSIDGKPLERGEVTFKSIAATRIGRVRDGQFKIDNLQPAQYTVTVFAANGTHNKAIPARYSEAEQSPLKFEVVSGENACEFELPAE